MIKIWHKKVPNFYLKASKTSFMQVLYALIPPWVRYDISAIFAH